MKPLLTRSQREKNAQERERRFEYTGEISKGRKWRVPNDSFEREKNRKRWTKFCERCGTWKHVVKTGEGFFCMTCIEHPEKMLEQKKEEDNEYDYESEMHTLLSEFM
jgi:hypothetical protein